MTTATEAYSAYLDFLESHGINVTQDETARAILRSMYDQIEGYLLQHKAAETKNTTPEAIRWPQDTMKHGGS